MTTEVPMTIRMFVSAAAMWGVLASPASAQSRCTRADLQSAVDGYLAAQAKGSASGLSLSAGATYVENMEPAAVERGILSSALKIDFHRSLLDVSACETFTEVIVTDKRHPYVLGIRLKVADRKISEIEALVTDQGDWLFNADNYLKYSPGENWGVIPPDARDRRDTLLAAANAYEDVFRDNTVSVPWGTPCNRLEGGIRTGKGQADDSCNAGVPSGMIITDRRFVVDPDIGAVVALSRFSINRLPDSHLFRVEKGKLRYVHTLTVCTIPNCGFPVRAPRTQ
jgi:hypothetical protein